MRILIANHHYFDLTGTETFVYTLAKSLKAKGCSVTIYAPYIGGSIVQKTKELGIDIVDDLKLIKPGTFDIAHVSHNLIAYKIRSWSLDIPMVFLSHGVLPFLEQPPVDDLKISAYLSVSEEVRDNLISKGVAREKILIFRNIIDTARFRPGSPINPSPQKALINSRRIDADTRAIIETACARLQINLVSIGDTGKVTFDVEKVINEVDIVFSLGRGILESMSCGRAAVVFDYNGGDGIVTPANLDEIQKCNFSGRRFGLKFDPDTLVDEIRKYSQELGKTGRDIIIYRFSADNNVNQLLNHYRNAIESFEAVAIDEKALNQLVSIAHETRSYSTGALWRKYESRIRNYEQIEAGLKGKNARMNKMVQDSNAEKANLEEALGQRDEQIKIFKAKLIEKEEDIVQLKETIEEKDDILKLKADFIKQLYEKIMALEDEKIRILEHEIKILGDKRRLLEEERRIERQRLENEISDRDRHINDLLNSKSWKMAAPLRTVHGLFIRLKKK